MDYVALHPNSFKSLYIELMFNDRVLASATAFLAGIGEKHLLFTNKHNVTGKNVITGEGLHCKGAIPNRLVVSAHDTASDGKEGFVSQRIVRHIVPLYDDEDKLLGPLWIEHHNHAVDVVGLIYNPAEYNVSRLVSSCEESWFQCEVGRKLDIIGYPFGTSTDGFPIWMSGYLASEPSIDVDENPMFYIDSRTRQGQSGSPVFYFIKPGDLVCRHGQWHPAQEEYAQLLGMYSGRISEKSDIGRVWKTKVLEEIIGEAKFEYE